MFLTSNNLCFPHVDSRVGKPWAIISSNTLSAYFSKRPCPFPSVAAFRSPRCACARARRGGCTCFPTCARSALQAPGWNLFGTLILLPLPSAPPVRFLFQSLHFPTPGSGFGSFYEICLHSFSRFAKTVLSWFRLVLCPWFPGASDHIQSSRFKICGVSPCSSC